MSAVLTFFQDLATVLTCGNVDDKLKQTKAAIEEAREDVEKSKNRSVELEKKLQRSKQKLEKLRKERDALLSTRFLSSVKEGQYEDGSPEMVMDVGDMNGNTTSNTSSLSFHPPGSDDVSIQDMAMLSALKMSAPAEGITNKGIAPISKRQLFSPDNISTSIDDHNSNNNSNGHALLSNDRPSFSLQNPSIATASAIPSSSSSSSSSASSALPSSASASIIKTIYRNYFKNKYNVLEIPLIHTNEQLLWQIFVVYAVYGTTMIDHNDTLDHTSQHDGIDGNGQGTPGGGSGTPRKVALALAAAAATSNQITDPKTLITAAMLKGGPEMRKFDIPVLQLDHFLQLLMDFSISKADITLSILRELFHLRDTITYREYILILVVIALAVHVIPTSENHNHVGDMKEQDHAVRKLLEEMDFSEHIYILEVRGLLEGRKPAHEFILL